MLDVDMLPTPGERPRDDALLEFGGCYREHSAAVHGIALRLCGSKAAADVTQEVFVHLWNNPGAYDPDRGSMRSFLLTVTRNKAVDVLRSETARRLRDERAHRSMAVPQPDVDIQVLREETTSEIVAALDALPAPERDAIVTAYFGRCSYREAALVLGEPEGTVKSRIRAGLAQLRASLADPRMLHAT